MEQCLLEFKSWNNTSLWALNLSYKNSTTTLRLAKTKFVCVDHGNRQRH